MSIEENMNAREVAEEILQLVAEEATIHGKVYLQKLVSGLREIAHSYESELGEIWPATVVARGNPMTNDEARKFEKWPISFGKHAGKLIGDVPVSYLVWLDEQDDFRKELNRYLRSDRGQRAQEH